MAQQTINLGAAPNDGTGDTLRDGGDKINDNFTELYAGLAGLLDLKGSTDCSANPNYPAASKGDAYVVSVAGKIGGASGVVVNAGDVYFATADNAGGTQAGVGTSWSVIEGNLGFSPVNKAGDTMTGDLVVPDEAYDATAWNGSLEVPTKNAVRDKIEAVVAGSGSVSDTVYGVGWDGDTTTAPSKNAVYDKIESLSGGGFTAASTTEQLTGTDSAKGSTSDSVAALWEQGSDVASSGTISIGEGGYFFITGTTTITDIDFGTDKAGRKAWVKFAGILTLTHNASTLILPTGANITTAAGDTACFVSEGSDVVRCVAYNRASGAALTSSGGSGTSYEYGPVTAPTTGGSLSTWVNQGTSTVTDGTGAMILKPQVGGNLRGREMNAPGAPFDLYMRADVDSLSNVAATNSNTIAVGFILRDSSDGEILEVGVQYERIAGDEQTTFAAIIGRWTNATTNSAYPVVKYNNRPWTWIRVNVTSTTVTFYVGQDGKNWCQVGTETISTFVDTIDKVGVYARGDSNSTEVFAAFSYFSTTAPA